MPYADTDFFIALVLEGDRLRSQADKTLARFKGRIWTSLAAVIEFALVMKRHGAKVEEAMRDLLELAEVAGVEHEQVLLASRRIDEGIGVFDAFHSVLCREEIISSDSVYDGFGLKRIPI